MREWLLYVDPGSGSYIVQVIVAAVLGAGFWIKMSWHRLRSFFSGDKSKDQEKHDKKQG